MSAMAWFPRLPAVPNDREERAALLAEQQESLAQTIALTPVIGKLAASRERSEPFDGYADQIARAYGK